MLLGCRQNTFFMIHTCSFSRNKIILKISNILTGSKSTESGIFTDNC